MVDQTPVLDIKPYIPQYDNPLYVEKLHIRLPGLEMVTNGNENLISETIRDRRKENLTNDHSDSSEVDSSSLPQEVLRSEDPGISDVSRDEEIALRLQAEEFQDNYYRDFENGEANSIVQYLGPRQETTSVNIDPSRNLGNEPPTRNTETEIIESSERIQNVILENTEGDIRRTEDQAWRNSRLLEGADGPSTICGTNLDLIQRRAMNSRLDNSPIRMGIREAPDGEEGFESQTLTPSQTVPNIQNTMRNLESLNGAAESASASGGENTSNQNIRIECEFDLKNYICILIFLVK